MKYGWLPPSGCKLNPNGGVRKNHMGGTRMDLTNRPKEGVRYTLTPPLWVVPAHPSISVGGWGDPHPMRGVLTEWGLNAIIGA